MNRSENIGKIAVALLKSQSTMGTASKDSKNPFFKSSYADLNSIREAALPVLNANGITVLQPMKILDGRTVIETVLLHESGEWMSSETPVVVNKQNDPQAEGSGQSYARRYGLQSFLNVGAEDDDGEKGMGRSNAKSFSSGKVTTGVIQLSTTTPDPNGNFRVIDQGNVQMATSISTAHLQNPNNTTTALAQAEGTTLIYIPESSGVSVEPLKKSSFRKPGRPAKTVENGSTSSEGQWS